MQDHLAALHALEARSQKVRTSLLKHKAAKNFFSKSSLLAHDLRQKSSRLLAGAGLTGALLLTPISANHLVTSQQFQINSSVSVPENLQQLLGSITPHTPTRLEPDQAKPIEDAIFQATGFAGGKVTLAWKSGLGRSIDPIRGD